MSRLIRSLVFFGVHLPPSLDWLMREFRLIVNKSVRIALTEDVRTRYGLTRTAYPQLSAEHRIYKQYIPSAFEVATVALKNYRRRLRKGFSAKPPFVKRLFFTAENQAYHLDRLTGELRVPIRAGEAVVLQLPVSQWHRDFLADESWSLGALTVTPEKVVVAVRKEAPPLFQPSGAISLDSNEVSLDGVACLGESARLVNLPFSEVRVIQSTHFRRKRHLRKKKERDWRVRRALLRREGTRERHRVRQRLHRLSKGLVRIARELRLAVILEDLKLGNPSGRSRRNNRRLSSWPRSQLHFQIGYKAALAGVPVIKVNPRYTSKTCPVCGETKGRRERVGRMFKCRCGWRMDRQLNAGLNILNTALASRETLARAVRFQPGALRNDVVIPLYDLPGSLGGAREEPSGVDPIPPDAASSTSGVG